MSTVAEWQAAYDRIRARYPWLPEASFIDWPATNQAFFVGILQDGRADFRVSLHLDVREQVMWHEAGHAAHAQAALLRDKVEGRGTAGDDIANEIGVILCGRPWTEPFDGLYKEYVAEAWRKANTGVIGPMGYPNPPGQVDPYPVQPLLAYFHTMAGPRVTAPSSPLPSTPSTPTAERRYCFDSTTASDIPAGVEIVAGYVDGLYKWSDADWALFPDSVKVRIAVFATTDDGHVGDVEPGCMTVYQAPGWVKMRREAGVDPTIYCSLGLWDAVRAAFQNQDIAEPHYWIAHYDNQPTAIYGAVAKQFANSVFTGKHYDQSVITGRWPGVEDDLSFTEDPAAQQFVKDVRDTLEAIKSELAKQAHHTHETGQPEAA